MNLQELITFLEEQDPSKEVQNGFAHPHSYRGYYDQLAFEPCGKTTIGDMLNCAIESVDKEFTGYKGGEYIMDEYTDVWLAEHGCCGESIGGMFLSLMIIEDVK